jgi:hypothetical protein
MIQLLPETYKFCWKHYKQMFFTKSLEVIEHNYNAKTDSMSLLLKNMDLCNLPNWKNYECRLKTDWFEKTKTDIQNDIQQTR